MMEHAENGSFYRIIIRTRVLASSVVAEVRPPFLADESCFLVEELSVHTWHFLHNFALPFPQWPVPATFRKCYITAVLSHDVFGLPAVSRVRE